MLEGKIPADPAAHCKLLPKERKQMQVIPPDKIGAYLKAAEEHGVLPMFYLELSTGLRRGELTALLWEDLNVKEKFLTVSKSVVRIGGELKVTEPKRKTRCDGCTWTTRPSACLCQEPPAQNGQ